MVRYIDKTRYRKSYRDIIDFYKRFVKNYPLLPQREILGFSFEDRAPGIPIVVSISPVVGGSGGSTHVVIYVVSSVGATSAALDGVNLTGFAIDDATHVSGDTVAHVAGTVDVTVTNSFGTSAPLASAFTFVGASVPVVSSISPNIGDVTGGTLVVIQVDSSDGAISAAIDGVNLTGFAIDDATHVSGYTVAHASGVVDVTVTNISGTSSPLAGGFTYAVMFLNIDFSALAVGPHTTASFLNDTKLTFTRSTTSTVQTSAQLIDSTPAINEACIGDRTGTDRGLVVQHNTKNLVGTVAGDASPRNLTVAWSAGTGTATGNYATVVGADGTSNSCSHVVVTSGQYGPFTSLGGFSNRIFSSWQRSSVADSMVMGWTDGTIPYVSPSIAVTASGTTTWQRLQLTSSAESSLLYFTTVEGRDTSATGGEAAAGHDVCVDFVQYESGSFSTEAIPLGLTRRANDRVSYATGGSDLIYSSRFKFHSTFTPKHASSMGVYFDGSTSAGTSAGWYLWSHGAAGNDYARINDSDKKLVISVGGVSVTSTNAISWSQYDNVEVYFDIGNSSASVAKYRIATGSWIDLALAATATPTISGALSLFLNDAGTATGDSGQLPSWIHTLDMGNFAPVITNILPTSGFELTASAITVNGYGFVSGSAITLSGSTCSSIVFVDSSQFTCDTPSIFSIGGPYDLKVTSPDARSSTLANAFTFVSSGSVPVISAVNYSRVDTLGGGERVVITVDDSTGCTSAYLTNGFSTAFLTSFAIDDATHVSGIPAATPGASGVYDIVVSNATGDSTTGAGLISYWTPTDDAMVTLFYDSLFSAYNAGTGAWTPRFGTDPTLVSPTPPAASGGAPNFDGDGVTERSLKTTGLMSDYVSANNAGGGTGRKGSMAIVASSTTTANANDYTMPIILGLAEPGPVWALGAGQRDLGGGAEHVVTAIHYDANYTLCSVAWSGALSAIVFRSPNDGTDFDVSLNGALTGAGYNSNTPVAGQGFSNTFVGYVFDVGEGYPANDAAYQLFAGRPPALVIANDVLSDTFVGYWYEWARQRYGADA